MKISVTDVPAAELDAEALVLAFAEKTERAAPWEAVDAALDGRIREILDGPVFQGKGGQSYTLAAGLEDGPRELVLVGLGPAEDVELETWRRAVGRGCRQARERGARRVAVGVAGLDGLEGADTAAAAAEAALLASYRFQEYKDPAPEQTDIDELSIATPAAGAEAAVERARVVAEASCWVRDLVNRPGNAKRTPELAEEALGLAESHDLRAELVDTKRCEEIGLNALLAVGSGSDAPPRMVILEHRPDEMDESPVVLVGKGITFDSGGISIKPSKNMGDMKGDMAGAAAVFGTLRAVAELGLRRWVVGITPLAENLPSSTSYRPGDILRAYGGTTIEVVNTDAEGRLILADALAYAGKRYEPACLVDLATLTGACVVALGEDTAGMMGNDDDLCDALLAAGAATGERLWRLPAWDEYDALIDSDVADVKNSGGRRAGVITAGKFLQRFVGDARWAHLDIAGPAFVSKAGDYHAKGGTGFGVRLLTHWLER